MHLYCDSNPTTPKGRLTRSPADPASLEILPVKLPREIEKGRFFDRWSLERLYGLRLTEAVIKASPDLVISANTPLDAQARLQAQCHGLRIPFIFWAQDLIGEATTRILQKKLPLGGSVIGAYYQIKEKTILRKSDRVIGITEDFAPYFKKAGILDSRVFTIPNWSPLAEANRMIGLNVSVWTISSYFCTPAHLDSSTIRRCSWLSPKNSGPGHRYASW